jgi:hypothetical protein
MKNKKHKKISPLRWCAAIICVLLSIAILAVGGFIIFDRVRHGSFYQDAEREFVIPGLNENFTPQGFDYLPDSDLYILCGYMSDDTASRIYTVDKDYKSSAPVLIKNQDGSDHTSHAGGISFYPGTDHVYLAGDGAIHLLSLTDILDGDGEATILGDIKVMMEPAYCTVRYGELYVGSYYYSEKYETPEGDRFVTPAGDQNYALLAAYALDPTTGMLTSDIPDVLYSTRGMIQGMAFADDDTLIFSTSWGLSTSHLYCYDLTAVDPAKAQTYTLADGTEMPILFLDSASCYADIVAPCMAEELVVKDGRVFIMNEAACNKYVFGKLLGAHRLYSYPIPEKEAK